MHCFAHESSFYEALVCASSVYLVLFVHYGDSVDETDKNFSVFSLMRMRWLLSAWACGQLNFAPTNPSVLNWSCQLMLVDLCSGSKTVIVIVVH